MSFLSNIKIIGFFQIIQSILIVLIYNIIVAVVFPPENINGVLVPSFFYIFSSQIVGFLLTGFSLIFLYKVVIPENFFEFKIQINNFSIMIILFLLVNLLIALYQLLIIKIIPYYLIPSYYSMQNELSKDYLNLAILLSKYHPSLLYLVGGLLPAVCEEFFFRGYLQNLALNKYKPINAILLVSFIFAFFHFQLIAFIPLFIFGIALGFLTYKTQRIIYSVILHFINNAITLYFINF